MTYRHLQKRLSERNIVLKLSDAAKTHLAREGYDPTFGARPLKRAIQKEIQNPLAFKLLQGEFRDGDTVAVEYDENSGELLFRRGA